jgi:chromosome segregation ATPase
VSLSDRVKAERVATPLHLLQTLTRTLNEHLSDACQQAEDDARKALEKLNRQHAKLEDKLGEAKEKLAARERGDEDKSVAKAQTKVAELDAALAELMQARGKAEDYVKQLKADIRQTLRLAKGFERIDGQVSQALEKRNNPTAQEDKPRTGQRRRSRKPPTDTGVRAEA